MATWDEPASWGGSTLSLYLVAWRDSSNNQEIHTVFSEAITLSAHNGSVLVAGEGYNLAIIARAQSNQGSPPVRYPPGSGFITAAVVAATVPDAPEGFTAIAVEGGASLSWSAPASDGGAAITGYVLTYGTVSAVLGNTLAATVGGLTAGEEYAFTLQAANSVGLGAAATAAASLAVVPPATVPDAPQSLSAVAGDGLIGLTWDAPNSDGGATITAYIVYANSAAALTASGDASAATLTGLTNGATYTLWVNARNSVGESSQSNATLATPQAAVSAPDAPAGFTAVAVEGGASLQWSAPASDGGASVTGYVLTYGSETINLGATLAATLGGLTPGAEYAFTLQAGNAVGLGAAATATATVPAVAPDAPAGFTASAIAGGASLSWSAPVNDGGASVTGYVLSYGDVSQNFAASVTATTLGGLTPGAEYAFTLQAANSAGAGAPATAAATIPAVLPGAPQSFAAVAVAGGASLSWLAPASDGGAAVTGYVLTYGTETINLGATLAATLGGLTPGAEYAFTLQAGNAVGLGAAATAAVAVPGSCAGRAGRLYGKRGRRRGEFAMERSGI